MVIIASTSSEDYYQDSRQRRIKVPDSREENRRLKYGHQEEDNSDIAYVNFSVLWPSAIFSVVSLIAFIGAIVTSLKTDYIPSERELLRGFVLKYGSSRIRCNSTIPFPEDGLPSILNLLELNVIGNVLFRYATCIPIILRVFQAHTVVVIVRQQSGTSFSRLHKICSDLVPMLTAIEALSMALFSIVTVHDDFPEANRFFKVVFSMTSSVNMMIFSVLMFHYSTKADTVADTVSISLKLASTCLYCYFAPQYFQHHQASISLPLCHSYIAPVFAIMEYVLIAAFLCFQLTTLIDLRHVTVTCYPRTCSGECQPLDPANFQSVEGPFQHCRAFEYNQRRIMSL